MLRPYVEPFSRPWIVNPVKQLSSGQVVLADAGQGCYNTVYLISNSPTTVYPLNRIPPQPILLGQMVLQDIFEILLRRSHIEQFP